MMSPADNPVGALFERYQTSGAPMPEIEVASTMLHIMTLTLTTLENEFAVTIIPR